MPDPLPISVLLLARDETRRLEALLPALDFAREVVVVWDPRGDPRARAVAERARARVFERRFDGFGPQRQFALARCSEPWVLWLDADERLTPDSVEALRRPGQGAGSSAGAPQGLDRVRRASSSRAAAGSWGCRSGSVAGAGSGCCDSSGARGRASTTPQCTSA